MNRIRDKIKFSKKTLIFLAIIAIGIFLRTWRFHDFLDFENDQVRDAAAAGEVIEGKAAWPSWGPTMRGSENAESVLFHLGPAYYHFQILSGKIFGNYPDKLAYPDLIFSILSIPLFYFLLRKYFKREVSLPLAALWAVSFFSIKYARFAWNPNSIPFFALLFLLSLYEFILQKEKTAWLWVAAAGISLGIGIQLHIITFILFGATAFFVFIYLIKISPDTWKIISMVVVLALILNFTQVISEFRTGFSNSRVFFASLGSGSASDKKDSLLSKTGLAADCQIEANGYILTSLGSQECNFSYATFLRKMFGHDKDIKVIWKRMATPGNITGMVFGLFFFIWGCYFLIRLSLRQKDPGKIIFLRLILFYAALSFLISVPIAEKYPEFRYYIHLFFLPYLFLGFLAEFLLSILPKNAAVPLVAVIFSSVVAFNVHSLSVSAQKLEAGSMSDAHFAILGEMESMVKYIKENSAGEKTIGLEDDGLYMSHFNQPFSYLAQKEGFRIEKVKSDDNADSKMPLFFIDDRIRKSSDRINGRVIEDQKNFGQIIIYKLK